MTMENKQFYINEEETYLDKTWWELRPEMLLLHPLDYAKVKTYVIESCRQNTRCPFEDLEDLGNAPSK